MSPKNAASKLSALRNDVAGTSVVATLDHYRHEASDFAGIRTDEDSLKDARRAAAEQLDLMEFSAELFGRIAAAAIGHRNSTEYSEVCWKAIIDGSILSMLSAYSLLDLVFYFSIGEGAEPSDLLKHIRWLAGNHWSRVDYDRRPKATA